MRPEQLEYVAAIARLGSFRRAAEELHISQPALSANVRNLERELGVDILERGRSGAHVSDQGRELLPHIMGVIDAFDRLRHAAGEEHQATRVLRIGAVIAGTVPLLARIVARFQALHPNTQLEVVGAQEADIDAALREGSLDLGLTAFLAGDDMPPDLETTVLLTGRPGVCMRPDSPLAEHDAISADQLASEPLILMRAGYLMHRYAHRLLAGGRSVAAYSTVGGEMAKLMVAEGLGATVLPDFSVLADPLARAGVLTWRPIAGDRTEVRLALRRRRSEVHARAARDLHALFVEAASTDRPMLAA